MKIQYIVQYATNLLGMERKRKESYKQSIASNTLSNGNLHALDQ